MLPKFGSSCIYQPHNMRFAQKISKNLRNFFTNLFGLYPPPIAWDTRAVKAGQRGGADKNSERLSPYK